MRRTCGLPTPLLPAAFWLLEVGGRADYQHPSFLPPFTRFPLSLASRFAMPKRGWMQPVAKASARLDAIEEEPEEVDDALAKVSEEEH